MSHGFIKMVSCAANKYEVTYPTGKTNVIVIADTCHGGRNMQSVIAVLREAGCEVTSLKGVEDRGQGFLDESGNFLTRSEAYKVAKASGQPFNDEYTLPNNKLDSSCIRHIKEMNKPVRVTLRRNVDVVTKKNKKYLIK